LGVLYVLRSKKGDKSSIRYMEGSRPRIFIFSRQSHPFTAARLPRELSRVGWSVAAMCKRDSLLWQTRFVDKKYVCPITPREILMPLVFALRNWEPDFVVPGDRWSLRYLQGMASSTLVGMVFPQVTDLLRKSLGHSDAYGVLDSKTALLSTVRTMDAVHTPRNREVNSVEHALSVIEGEYDFPIVVKQEHCSGGAGVWICRDRREVESVVSDLLQDKSEESFLYSLWKTYNQIPFMRDIDDPGSVSVQRFIDGEPHLHSFVALEGKIIGGNTVQRELPYDGPHSPHCRYRATENEEIQTSARAIVDKTGFSGFGCFDFIVDRKRNVPYLIECNPFPVNVAHLGHVLGKDLCKALRRRLTNQLQNVSENKSKLENDEGIAIIFPYELYRDPYSNKLLQHSHDVPLDDPKLIESIQNKFEIPNKAIDRIQKKWESGSV